MKTSMLLELGYSGMRFRNLRHQPAPELFAAASSRLFNFEQLKNEEHPLLSMLENYALSFDTPSEPVNRCVTDYLNSPVSETLHTVCGNIINTELLNSLANASAEVVDPILNSMASSITVSLGLPDGMAFVFANLIRNELADFFPGFQPAVAPPSLAAQGKTLLAHAFSELFGVNKAQAQTLVLEGLAVVAIAVLVVLAYIGLRNLLIFNGVIQGTPFNFTFNFDRIFHATHASNSSALQTGTLIYNNQTLAFEDSTNLQVGPPKNTSVS
ncbi:MAG: hypothetical protein IPJ88_08980 [Myxococcales bacterium]|nr:MAG: hypothetical protein IPJ88_08980 [Myxococcales bacterium]